MGKPNAHDSLSMCSSELIRLTQMPCAESNIPILWLYDTLLCKGGLEDHPLNSLHDIDHLINNRQSTSDPWNPQQLQLPERALIDTGDQVRRALSGHRRALLRDAPHQCRGRGKRAIVMSAGTQTLPVVPIPQPSITLSLTIP